eukprot:SM002471S08227  [mRNA]  locus=s2471:12:1744:- [translate_table: standard]
MGAGPAGAYAAYGQAPGAAYRPPQYGGFPAPQAAPYGYGAPAAAAAPAADPNQAAAGDAPSGSDWQEATAQDGRKYYYNRRTRQSSWEKPPEMMTAQERADASAIWKEFTTPDGRKYYYNKVTKQSKWTMPDEMKVRLCPIFSSSVPHSQAFCDKSVCGLVKPGLIAADLAT